MSDRFYSAAPITTDHVTIDGSEAHHLLHVMRAKVGDVVMVFDGSGSEFQAHVEKLGRSAVELHIVERAEKPRSLQFPLLVGVALPKGDRQKWLVEKLTELGVTSLVPLITERSVAEPTGNALERLRRSVIEAAKQCGRNQLMEITEPMKWNDWLTEDFGLRISNCGIPNQSAIRKELIRGSGQSEIVRLVAHPDGASLASLRLEKAPTILAIGPEGGFTDAEIDAAGSTGWSKVSLGETILRTETAAIALSAAIALHQT